MISLPSSLLTLLLGAAATAAAAATAVEEVSPRGSVYRYNVCNGLSNQLLYHAASIASAIQQGYEEVEVPDYFIVNGAQANEQSVLPSTDNSVSFGQAFDAPHFLRQVENLGIQPRLVQFKSDSVQPDCAGMGALQKADSSAVLEVLEAFRPSETLSEVIESITSATESQDLGVCVHHRSGEDWTDHCDRWSKIQDGTYRGNCLSSESLMDSLASRVTSDSQWVYYCGDHDTVPAELEQESKYSVVSRKSVLTPEAKQKVENLKPGQTVRDLWALIDFWVCQGLSHFVGNSVSTFSALQIALRHGDKAYWYNTQGIPLADFWNVYEVPIVYTYTELSQASGKHLLQASIASVRKHMPQNKIHILYHGKADTELRAWLLDQGVTIHAHDPTWKEAIDNMRKNGDSSSSHLFSHAGNYFGTWQRIDVPLFLDTEYALLLDLDTIVTRPFTMADFGQDLTRTLAMSSEIDVSNSPSNAGVMVMNVPYMRKTYQSFMDFILEHVQSPRFNNLGPSDQGAYLEFYQDATFLSRCFNFKPYYRMSEIECERPFIVHFHGAKPHDYLQHIMGDSCHEAIHGLCDKAFGMPSLCLAFQAFARSSQSVNKNAYCNDAFSGQDAALCNDIMDALLHEEGECTDMASVIRETLAAVPYEPDTPKEVILRNLASSSTAAYRASGRMLQSMSPSMAPSMGSHVPSQAPSSGTPGQPTTQMTEPPSVTPGRGIETMKPTGGESAAFTRAFSVLTIMVPAVVALIF